MTPRTQLHQRLGHCRLSITYMLTFEPTISLRGITFISCSRLVLAVLAVPALHTGHTAEEREQQRTSSSRSSSELESSWGVVQSMRWGPHTSSLHCQVLPSAASLTE